MDRSAEGDPVVREDKIAAIGVRVETLGQFHGISINVEPDLAHYEGIVPCGISEFGVTSLKDPGVTVSMTELDDLLKNSLKPSSAEMLYSVGRLVNSRPGRIEDLTHDRAYPCEGCLSAQVASTDVASPSIPQKTASTLPSLRLRTQSPKVFGYSPGSRSRRDTDLLYAAGNSNRHRFHGVAHSSSRNRAAASTSIWSISRRFVASGSSPHRPIWKVSSRRESS